MWIYNYLLSFTDKLEFLRSSNEEPEHIRLCKNSKFKKILKLLHHVDKSVNLGEQFRDSNILDIKIISVDTNWRGKGVGKALMEKTM